MPNISDIRFHIKSVKQTRQITNAMHMVSAARMRRALDGIQKNREYFLPRARHHRGHPTSHGRCFAPLYHAPAG